MLIFDDNANAVIIESVSIPLTTDYFWVLDLSIMDFTVTSLLMLEEIVAPTITLEVQGFSFPLPTTWSMLVYSEETTQIDVVEVKKLPGNDFTAMVYGPNESRVQPGRVKAINYDTECANYGPSLNKHQMLCHPIGPDLWVNVAPSDVYNKYLKDKIVGDILY